MKTRLGTALVLALFLTVAMIAVGTVTLAPKSSGPYVSATSNYAVATAEAVSCPNKECEAPGTSLTTCRIYQGKRCSIGADGFCHTTQCIKIKPQP